MKRSPLYLILSLYLYTANVGSSFAQTAGYTSAGTASVSSTPDALLNLVQEFEGFKKLLTSIDARLKTLQTTIEQKFSSSDDSKSLVREISDAIRALKYHVAGEKLNELGDKNKISNIVHDVYAGSSVNMDIILEFAKALSNTELQFLVFDAVRDEMKSSGNSDPFILMALVEAMERELKKQTNEQFKAKSQAVIKNAVEDVKVAATSILKTAMISNKYINNVEIDSLANAIFDFRNDVSNDVMEAVVDGVFGVIAAGRILDNISSHKSIPQVITGLIAIFNRFNFAGNLNNDATLNLASHLHKIQQRQNYPDLGQDLKDDVDKVIQQLPACARNLFFNTYICLWNKARKQYIYAASSTTSHDDTRRSIYSWYPGHIKEGAYWYAEKMGDDFFFKNRDHTNEYLYTADIDYSKDMRYVFTWIPGNNTDPQSAWIIELDDDYCYLKNRFFNEYLFAPTVKYDELNSYVFSWKPGTSVRGAEFQWQVRNCGQSEIQTRKSS